MVLFGLEAEETFVALGNGYEALPAVRTILTKRTTIDFADGFGTHALLIVLNDSYEDAGTES